MAQAYSDYFYQSDDGLQLYARDYPCQDRAQQLPQTVLCMHGLSRNSADFAELSESLCQRYRVLAVDQRGRGRSDYDSRSENYVPARYVEDMFTLLDGLDLHNVILIGTSMGGLMAMMMAAAQPQRFAAVVLNDIGPEVAAAGLARIKSYVGKFPAVESWEEAVAQVKSINGPAFPDFDDAQWLDFCRRFYRQREGKVELAYDANISKPFAGEDALPPDLWPLFNAIVAPVLVLRGELSDILDASCVVQMCQRKPSMQSAEIPHRGHAPTLNEAASRAAIERFLAHLR